MAEAENGSEFIIDSFQRTKSIANIDDSICYWKLILKKGGL